MKEKNMFVYRVLRWNIGLDGKNKTIRYYVYIGISYKFIELSRRICLDALSYHLCFFFIGITYSICIGAFVKLGKQSAMQRGRNGQAYVEFLRV